VGATETERVYLSGRDKDHTVDWEFMCTTGAKSNKWTTLPVPSNWDVLGFGMLNYKKDIETALEERGLYRHEFPAPSEWADKRVFLVFEGSMTDTAVKINGQSAGPLHQGGFYRFKYEITDRLKLGEQNLLEVDVAKHSANESVNKAERTADFWVFGGIYRPVYLEVMPQQFVERVAINAQADGAFTADVFLNGAGNADHIEAQVVDLDGKSVGPPISANISDSSLQLNSQFENVRQWTAESPNLYLVEFRLFAGDKVLHTLKERFGFRTIEVRQGDGIYVNGKRVVLKGVNRHSTWPDSGRCLSEDVHRLDIETIKDMNMNAVRMSHYPPDVQFLDLCDELGLYVLDELAGWHWHYDTPTGRQLAEALITRDVNHPCVLFWDNGNEGGFNVALDEVFREFDPQCREVLHAWEAYRFINTAHYLEYNRAKVASQGAPTRHGPTEVYQEWEDTNDPNKYIYMPTEMLHGLYDGGGGAGLADYWELMRKSPVLGGGFLWDLFDEGIKRLDGTIDCAGNQAPDGIVGPYRQREASFYTIKELWSPIVVTRNDNNLTIENRYDFTNAKDCKLTWQLRRLRKPHEQEAGSEILGSGTSVLPDIPPGETGILKLDLPSLPSHRADLLAATVTDPQDRELWTWTWPLRTISLNRFILQQLDVKAPQLVETDTHFTVTSGECKFTIDKQTGLLSGVERGGQRFSLNNGPIATTGKPALKSLTHKREGDVLKVAAEFYEGFHLIGWSFRGDNGIECSYTYPVEGQHDYFGVTFDYPEKLVRGKKWLGRGPFRVWKNRLHGVSLNVWENNYNDTITGYSGWEYPEFKGCFAGVHWLQLDTQEGPITIVPGNPSTFVQVLTPSFPPRELEGETKVNLPPCGIALLDAIPPVGSKFKTAATTGPRGQQSESFNGYCSGSVKLYFGELPNSQLHNPE
jgi:beta-galactosidase/beta-glucuronidase